MNKLLAPNGKPSKLTAEQYKLVRTPAFKKWFGDWENSPETASKVVDEETKEPLVCYHGTPNATFSKFQNGLNFFSENKDYADNYKSTISSSRTYGKTRTKEGTYQVFLNLKNPFEPRKDIISKKIVNSFFNDTGTEWMSLTSQLTERGLLEWIDVDNFDEWLSENKIKNFDGYIVDETSILNEKNEVIWRGIGYVTTKPNQIKLADGTNTTFYRSKPDIRFDNGGRVEKYEIGGIYQGTPHNFNTYSTEYIGTGEGQQAFGWGLYFTNIKDIAKNYAKNELLIQKEIVRKSDNPSHLWIYTNISDNVIDKLGYLKIKLKEFEELKKEYKKDTWDNKIETYSTLIDIIQNYQGKIYSVTLFKGKKETDYNLLDWNKKPTKKILSLVLKQLDKDGIYYQLNGKSIMFKRDNKDNYFMSIDLINGMTLYNGISSIFYSEDKQASMFLLRAGIDGIRYEAGTLSGFEDKDGYNYVIFDANDIAIEGKEKYADGGGVNTGLFSQIWDWFGIKF